MYRAAVSPDVRSSAVLELAILGLLKEQSMHGYELRKQLASKLGFFWTVSFGSLYPTLAKLERRGVIEKIGGEASRRRQVYAITDRGESEFLELLVQSGGSAWDEDKFPLRLTFFRYLRPETRIRLLERRRTYLEDKLDFGRTALRRAGRADSYTVSLMRHALETTERDIAWLDDMIAAEHRIAAAETPTSHADRPAPAHSEDGGTDTANPSEELQSQ